MDLSRQSYESIYEYTARMVKAKQDGLIGYSEFGDNILGDKNRYSDDNIRKAFYVLEILKEIDEEEQKNNGILSNVLKVLSISDLHIPFQLPIKTFEKYSGMIDILQLNGDLFDLAQCSCFPKVYRTSQVQELVDGRKYLINLINLLKPKKVVVNDGNHDVRMGKNLQKVLDNDIQELHPMSALEYIFEDGFTHYDRQQGTKIKYESLDKVFPDIEIEYTHTWYSIIESVIFVHPFTFSSMPMKTAEKALVWFRNEGYNPSALVCGHTHRRGEYCCNSSMIYESGASCYTEKMLYHDGKLVNSQQKGHIFVCINKETGKNIPELTKIEKL